MTRYYKRLERIEEAVSPVHEARCCVIFGDNDDTETAVAAWRIAQDWPDDGAHPVNVIRVRWTQPGDENL